MAKYRPFLCSFWTDPDIEKFSSEEKLVYAFLFTNSLTTESGIYDISHKFISERTNISINKINNIINTLSNTYHKITYDNKTVFVHGFLNRNGRGRPELIEKSLLADINNFPSFICWTAFLSVYKNHYICNKINEVLKSLQRLDKTSIEIEDRNSISISIKEGVQGENFKTSFEIYQKEELDAYNNLLSDREWLSQQEKLKAWPNLNILKSLEKAHLYWSSEAAWKYKKSKQSKEINWKTTYQNALTIKCNQVNDNNLNNNQPSKSISDFYGDN
jgi:hypothetical protein